MKTRSIFFALAGGLSVLAGVVVTGCDDASNTNNTVTRDLSMVVGDKPDLSMQAANPDLAPLPPDMGCYGMPMTHVQIINACTTSKQVDKKPTLPLLNGDGSLPPLP